MRKAILVPALLCGMTVIAGAQTKITGRLSCTKPTVSEAAGDGAHTVMFNRSNCSWSTPFAIDGSKPGRTVNAAIGDATGSSARAHGYSTSVMDNGGSTVVRCEGAMQMKGMDSAAYKGTWKYVRGTGKFRGIGGGGTYRGAGATDGTLMGRRQRSLLAREGKSEEGDVATAATGRRHNPNEEQLMKHTGARSAKMEILPLRVVVGLVFLMHGALKLFVFGLGGTADIMG